MNRLKVAIVGRPNVGKSTLFNQLTGSRRALVKDEPGVTRDVQLGKVDWCGYEFDIFDTAGISGTTDKAWTEASRNNAIKAAEGADKILFILDGKYGLNPEDSELAKMLKKLKKPVLTVVNKVDVLSETDTALSEFFELGMENMISASFEHKTNLDDVLDWVISGLDPELRGKTEQRICIAIVGKPNAGKSTLANRILGEERVVVSPVAGTTVDSVEIPFERNGILFNLIDTAGIRRHAKRQEMVEYVSAHMSEDSIQKADIVIILIDGTVGPTQQDSRIVEMALEGHKAVIMAINKTDIAEKKIPKFRNFIKDKVNDEIHYFRDIPLAFISAKTGKGVNELFDLIVDVWKKLTFKVSTREINDFFTQVIRLAPSPSFQNRDVKFYYITQTNQRPPSFMTFVNEPRAITNAYKRFVAAQIKKKYDLLGIPVRIYAKKRSRYKTTFTQDSEE